MDYSDIMYNEYVMGDRDYHQDLMLQEWEYYSLYEETEDEEKPETD